jgi:hypothetical protein
LAGLIGAGVGGLFGAQKGRSLGLQREEDVKRAIELNARAIELSAFDPRIKPATITPTASAESDAILGALAGAQVGSSLFKEGEVAGKEVADLFEGDTKEVVDQPLQISNIPQQAPQQQQQPAPQFQQGTSFFDDPIQTGIA